MPLKPSILDEYGQRRGLPAGAAAGPGALVSGDDALLLEDEASRVRLLLEGAQLARLVTGLVVAVRATELPGGDVRVHQLTCLPPRPAPPLPRAHAPRRLLAIMSGLQLGARTQPAQPLLLELAVAFLCGRAGPAALAADVVRVLLVGDLLAELDAAEQAAATAGSGGRLGGAHSASAAAAAAPLRQLDALLAELAAAVPVTVMPGRTDPANFALPQQPLASCLLPNAARHASLTLAPNPHEFELDGVRLLGSAGQPLADLEKYVAPRTRLELLADTATWGHLAPTTPDTLGCYPFAHTDPFVLEQLPHVYFAGNQPAFASSLMREADATGGPTRLLAVPAFNLSPTIVLLDLATLECSTVDLSAYAMTDI